MLSSVFSHGRRCVTLLINTERQPTAAVIQHSIRGFAKSKNRGHQPKVQLRDDELVEVVKIHAFREQLKKSLNSLGENYLKQLTITNAAAGIDQITVNFENDTVQLSEVAIIQKKPNLVVLQFSSFPEAIKPAVSAIEGSGLRVSIQQEGTTVYLHLPKVTREQREGLAKNAKMLFQKCKDNLIATERKYTKEIQMNKDGQSADLIFNASLQIKAEITETVEKAETMMKAKQKELLGDQ